MAQHCTIWGSACTGQSEQHYNSIAQLSNDDAADDAVPIRDQHAQGAASGSQQQQQQWQRQQPPPDMGADAHQQQVLLLTSMFFLLFR
jgi:hypothetical protein